MQKAHAYIYIPVCAEMRLKMTINDGFRFIYANQSSDEFGVFKGAFGNGTDNIDEATGLITSKTMFQEKWSFHGIEKNEPLKFKLTIAKSDGTYFDAYEERAIKKWLCKKKRHWLYIDQDDLANIGYYCILLNPQKVSVGLKSAGISFDVICDSNHAWSDLQKQRRLSSDGTFQFIYHSDFDEEVLTPVFTITPLSDGTIKIKNRTTGKEVSIDHCITTETITMDCENEIMVSSSGRVLIGNWNKRFLQIIEGVNMIELTGDFVLDMEYRLPVRIGG